ncbi:MAG TPA: hypothetical protein VK590_03170 [Saprospiraceae bacterium]|nr:hypothetical protein [Saprospiraceae bacterium]
MKYAYYKNIDGYQALVEILVMRNNGFANVKAVKVFKYASFGYGQPGDCGEAPVEDLMPLEEPIDLLKKLL